MKPHQNAEQVFNQLYHSIMPFEVSQFMQQHQFSLLPSRSEPTEMDGSA
jgi:hypothetical protein